MEILNLLTTSFVSIFVGLGGGILFYRSRNRKERAEAMTTEHSAESVAIANMRESAVEWKMIAEKREAKINKKDKQIAEKDSKIDALYIAKNQDRDEINSLYQKLNNLELEKQSLQFKSCNIRGCDKREPQTGF
ncbi:MAG: hypothetical protein R3Y04_08880 [Rikenellaceae bacterium]